VHDAVTARCPACIENPVAQSRGGESPRWHEDRLWLSDWGAHESVAADLEGNSTAGVRTPCGLPCCIDGLPEGRLLRVSGSEHRRLRQEPAGSLVRHVDRRSRSEQW
jgi:sugar lactone lactonase YvrE